MKDGTITAVAFLYLAIASGYGSDQESSTMPVAKGKTIPQVQVKTAFNKTVNLRDVIYKKPTVLIFYRGGWCPYCSRHLKDIQTIEKQLRDWGFQIVAVSPDRPEELRASIDQHSLAYTLLSDSHMNAARSFGISFRLDGETFARYRKLNLDIEAASGLKHHLLPIPSLYLVDKSGKVHFSHSNDDYKVRIQTSEILRQVKKMMGLKEDGNK